MFVFFVAAHHLDFKARVDRIDGVFDAEKNSRITVGRFPSHVALKNKIADLSMALAKLTEAAENAVGECGMNRSLEELEQALEEEKKCP